MTASMQRPQAVLKLPSRNPARIAAARVIVARMTDNPWFPSPTPSLASVTAAIDAFHEAEVATLSRARGAAAVRDAKRTLLTKVLGRLQAYVQGVADDNPESAVTIIESAGMSVKKPTSVAKAPFAVQPGDVSGSVRLVLLAVAKRASYEWQWSRDGGKTWNTAEKTLTAKTVVSGLPAETTCLFRHRATTRTGMGDWSEPVAFLVR
ncbi:MAG TPA: fibronectin type III domain-containing protein [Polyangiaceae bacterium]|jgi:hypothetical protein